MIANPELVTEHPGLLRRFSPAALNRYLQCPHAFLWADVEHRSHSETPSSILCQDNAAHHALERFYGLPLEERSPENLKLALRSVWPEHRHRSTFRSREEEAACGRATLAMLAGYADGYDLSVEPLAREQWVSLRLENGTELFGKVDRIDAGVGGGLVLVDYVTGRHQIDPDDIDEDVTVQLYAVAAQATYGKPVEQVRLLYLQSGDEARWMPEPEDLDRALERLNQLVGQIATDPLFAATLGDHCRSCPFALSCPRTPGRPPRRSAPS